MRKEVAKMKMEYTKPVSELKEFAVQEVLTASSTPEKTDDNFVEFDGI